MKASVSIEYDFCVIIPCYNDRDGLIESLQSICYNPVKHLVVVPHLHIIRLEKNGGITRALNAGLQYIAGRNDIRYIARLDCGDICSPERFESQVEFLDSHPDIDLVGSWCIFKDYSTEEAYRYTIPTEHSDIIRDMHFRNVFIHPTVMWRAGIGNKVGAYPETFPHAEDYGFFYELLQHGRAAVLPHYLMTCAVSPTGISLTYRREQMRSRIKVVRRYGNNAWYRLLGELRLRLWMLLPAQWALRIKKQLRNI
jgi:glycosyltransferase involved in cell wall biosynthesis